MSELDDLFALAPGEFVAARGALVRKLKAEKRAAEAQQAAALRKPALGAWVVNQLARRNARLIADLIDATGKLRAAQSGPAGGAGLREAMKAQREALTALGAAASAFLREAGQAETQALDRRIQSTLQAAAAGEPDLRARLTAGTLQDELEPLGFGGLLGGGAGALEVTPKAPEQPAATPRAPAAQQANQGEPEQARGAAHSKGGPAPQRHLRAVERPAHEAAAAARASAAAAKKAEGEQRRRAEAEARNRAAEQARLVREAQAQERKAHALATAAERLERAAARSEAAAARAREAASRARAEAAQAARDAEAARARVPKS